MPSGSSRRSSRSAIAEPDDAAAPVPPLARLALAYAPAQAREPWLTLLLLDARLAGVVRTAREPMLAQLRLAWWRDRLNENPAAWPKGEPLLARLAPWGEAARGLVGLVDGWEALLDDPPFDAAVFDQFAQGRAAGAAALAGVLGSDEAGPAQAGEIWGLAELALHLGDETERQALGARLAGRTLPSLDRAMRPLLLLAGLSLRAVKRGSRDALDGPGALFAAIRLGIAGR